MNQTGIFNIENPIWRYLGFIADAFVLTMLWVCTSLLVITAGASTTALYAATLRMMRFEEGSMIKQYFSDFKLNFKQSTIAAIIMAPIGGVLFYNLYVLIKLSQNASNILVIAYLIFGFVFLMVAKFIFPVIARFSNSLPNLFVMAFVMAFKNFGWTLLMITISVSLIVVSVFVFWPLLFLVVGAIALFDSWIINHIFEKHIEEHNIV